MFSDLKQMVAALFVAGIACATVVAAGPAIAAYPEKAVRIIVPFGAGDAIDGTARVLADGLKEELGVPVVVQNIPGAGGGQGTLEAARAAPDGYTLLMGSTGALTAAPLIRDAGYHTDDFIPIAQLVEVPIGLAVRDQSPFSSVADVIEAAESDPGGVRYSTPAPGSTQHINMEAFANQHGVEFTHIGGAGGTGAITKAMSGEVDFVFVGASNYASLARSGQLRVLGVAAPERVPYLPDAPTFREQDYEVDSAVWFGVLAPEGTPESVVNSLENAIAKVIQDPETKKMYDKFHFNDAYLEADAFQGRIEENVAAHRVVLREIGLIID